MIVKPEWYGDSNLYLRETGFGSYVHKPPTVEDGEENPGFHGPCVAFTRARADGKWEIRVVGDSFSAPDDRAYPTREAAVAALRTLAGAPWLGTAPE